MKARRLVFVGVILITLWIIASSVYAAQYSLGDDRDVNILGSLSNQVQWGRAGDHYDTQPGFQQWLTSFQLMMDFNLGQDTSAYLSGIGTIDWAYDINGSDDDWKDKGFDDSRDNLYFDDEWWQLLSEAHVTYAPGQFMFRVGKQLVKWGEMEGSTVLDQINPTDDRRGFGDVEFETYNIAIPMIRAEYWPDIYTDLFSAPNLQFLFIPNTPFIHSTPEYGMHFSNREGGIYALDYVYEGERWGRNDFDIDEPDDWDSDHFEYGIKLSGQIKGSIFSLVGFYGRENSPALNYDYKTMGSPVTPYFGYAEDTWRKDIPNFPVYNQRDDDGNGIGNYLLMGEYPRQKFVGTSLSTELSPLKISAIGGTAPLLRLESRYDIDKTFVDDNFANEYIEYYMDNWSSSFSPDLSLLGDPFVESDYWVNGISLEQKIKLSWLQSSYFFVQFEYTQSNVMDHDPDWSFKEQSESYYAYISTSYFSGKLVPAFFFQRVVDAPGVDGTADLYWPGVYYYWSSNLNFYVGTGFFEGEGADPIRHKDYAVFKVTYNF